MNRFREEAIAILKLGGPLIAAQIAQVSIGFVDTVMAGNLSADTLAAVAIGSNVWFLVVFVCMGLLMSVSPCVAQLYGAGKYEEIGPTVRQGLWLALGAAFVGSFAFRLAPPLFAALHIVPEVVPTAVAFIRAISWGLPAMCIYQVLRSFSEGVSMTRPVMYASVLALAGCTIGDYILMYGRFGMPKLGAVGSGVASAIVVWLMTGFMAAYIYIKPEYRKYAVFDRMDLPDTKAITAFLKLGLPIAVSLFMEGSFFGSVTLLMGSLGTNIVAGHQIAINFASITFMVPLGIAMAVTVRVGQAVGRGERPAARVSGFVGVSLAAAFMTLSAIVLFTAPGFIAGMYTNDPDVRRMAVTLLIMAGVFQIFDGMQVSGSGALRGLKDTKVPMLITAFAYWGIGMPLGYFLAITRGGGPQGFWVGFICGLLVAATLMNLRFHISTRDLR